MFNFPHEKADITPTLLFGVGFRLRVLVDEDCLNQEVRQRFVTGEYGRRRQRPFPAGHHLLILPPPRGPARVMLAAVVALATKSLSDSGPVSRRLRQEPGSA